MHSDQESLSHPPPTGDQKSLFTDDCDQTKSFIVAWWITSGWCSSIPRHPQLSISIQPLHDLSYLTRRRLCFSIMRPAPIRSQFPNVTSSGGDNSFWVSSWHFVNLQNGSSQRLGRTLPLHAIHRPCTHQNYTTRRQSLHTVRMNKNINASCSLFEWQPQLPISFCL